MFVNGNYCYFISKNYQINSIYQMQIVEHKFYLTIMSSSGFFPLLFNKKTFIFVLVFDFFVCSFFCRFMWRLRSIYLQPGANPYHVTRMHAQYSSYNPVSRQDSELQSVSSDARTESDTMSLNGSSV